VGGSRKAYRAGGVVDGKAEKEKEEEAAGEAVEEEHRREEAAQEKTRVTIRSLQGKMTFYTPTLTFQRAFA